ncbi:MAG: heavy-metal-associated domain-containing protein [Sphingobacteriales bacterium JAD_PAG50586_3]|nr:MAG: heavy-metal-associated domain-containing protein [Sphingobacteriales bacterium JAD_PAG50586_3]
MTHTYQITGMTCSSCEAKVKGGLLSVPDITSVEVSKDTNTATVSMDKHIPLSTLQDALGGKDSKYQISVKNHNETAEAAKSWVGTYRPLLVLFGLITIVSFLIAHHHHTINLMEWMNAFMAGFFLSFSYFKLINLKGFAESYAMYDVVAKRFNAWGYIYAFIELGLGLAYVTHFEPVITNAVTLTVMSISIIGVLQSVLNKKKIQCACLGAVFNLPMSTVTIVEDALMIAMSAGMLIVLYT